VLCRAPTDGLQRLVSCGGRLVPSRPMWGVVAEPDVDAVSHGLAAARSGAGAELGVLLLGVDASCRLDRGGRHDESTRRRSGRSPDRRRPACGGGARPDHDRVRSASPPARCPNAMAGAGPARYRRPGEEPRRPNAGRPVMAGVSARGIVARVVLSRVRRARCIGPNGAAETLTKV